jgi:hypothetical protein
MSEFWMSDAYGGSDADHAVGKIAGKVKERLEKLNAKSYSTVLKEFGIRLWVDGEISHSKELGGVSAVRMYPKKKMASFIIVMKEGAWKKGPQATKKFFQDTLLSAFQMIVEKADKQKVAFDGGALLKDVERVLRKL